MSSVTSSTAVSARAYRSSLDRMRAYLFSDRKRAIQTALGLIWLLDGALQFQSFMYGPGFIKSLSGMASGQPHWLGSTLLWGAHTIQSHQVLYNTLAALIQIAIGFGILYRRTTKQALVFSFVWALAVWWFGEAFGMLFTNAANPLTGAPGAVLLYVFIGAVVWPNARPGGLLGRTGARILWGQLWCLMGALWLLGVNSGANATYGLIKAAPAGMGWLASLQTTFADVSKGHGLIVSVVLAAVSISIGLAVALNWRPRTFLRIAITLNLVYWIVGQGAGGILAGGATDPNAGPLFVLLSVAFCSLLTGERSVHPDHLRAVSRRARQPNSMSILRFVGAILAGNPHRQVPFGSLRSCRDDRDPAKRSADRSDRAGRRPRSRPGRAASAAGRGTRARGGRRGWQYTGRGSVRPWPPPRRVGA
jgi:hypothetical protein